MAEVARTFAAPLEGEARLHAAGAQWPRCWPRVVWSAWPSGPAWCFDVAGLNDGEFLDLLALLGVIAVPWCFLVGLARTALTRGGAVGDLVARLRGALGPDTVRGSLAAALGTSTTGNWRTGCPSASA